MAFLNPLSNAFGLDIGDRSFKLAQIERTMSKKTPHRLQAWGEIAVPEGVMAQGDVMDVDAAAKLIRELMANTRGRLRGRGVVACLPEAKTFIKIIEVPANITQSGLKRAVQREIDENIPLPRNDIYYDWQALEGKHADTESEDMHTAMAAAGLDMIEDRSEPTREEPAPKETSAEDTEEGSEKGTANGEASAPEEAPIAHTTEPDTHTEGGTDDSQTRIRVLIGAAPKSLVDTYTEMLEKAGLAPVGLEIEATAITRALMPFGNVDGVSVGLLDIGATRSSLVIYDNGVIQMSISIPVSGMSITETISTALGVTVSDAEKLKIECGLDADRCEDRMWKILTPLIEDMTEKIRSALRFYHIGFPHGKRIERILLCGGGAHFKEIDTVLSQKLAIRVERGDALSNLHGGIPRPFPANDALSYATAFGLGIRAAEENRRNRNRFY